MLKENPKPGHALRSRGAPGRKPFPERATEDSYLSVSSSLQALVKPRLSAAGVLMALYVVFSQIYRQS